MKIPTFQLFFYNQILHQNGIDLKETLNLELSMMSDDQIKSVLSSSPANSSRNIVNNQQKQQNQDDEILDHVNEPSILYEQNQVNTSSNPKISKFEDSQNGSPSKIAALSKFQNVSASINNDLDDSKFSSKSSIQNQDWIHFMKRYQEKLKPIRQIDKKLAQIDKTHLNELNEKFFQETLKQKIKEQSERKIYLQNLQNSFDSNQSSDTDQIYSTGGDTQRKVFESRLSNFLNKGDKFNFTNRKFSLQNYSSNLENSLSQEDAYFVGQNNSKVFKKESELSPFFTERQKLHSFSINDNIDIQKLSNFEQNKLPKLDFSSINSEIDSKQSLSQFKSMSLISQQSRNENNIQLMSIKKIGSQLTTQSHRLSLKQQPQKSKISSENKAILNSDNSNSMHENQIFKKQPEIQEGNLQMQEYYVNSKFLKKNENGEPYVIQNIKSKQKLNQSNTLNSGKKQPMHSLISQINMSCGVTNVNESPSENQRNVEDKVSQKTPTQIMKFITNLYPNNQEKPAEKNNERNIDQQKNYNNQSNLSSSYFFSNSKGNLRSVQKQNRQMIGVQMLSLEDSSHKSNNSTQFEGNKNTILNGSTSNRSNREENILEIFNKISIDPDKNQKNISQIDSKKSMSFSSKHNMFRNKPKKLYLIDRYNADNSSEEKQIQKNNNFPSEMNISKVKIQQTLQNVYQS